MKDTIIQKIIDMYGFDKETALEIYAEFLDAVNRNMTLLHDAIESMNCDEVKRAAHTLKGCAANVQFESMRVVALELETHIYERDKVIFSKYYSDLQELQKGL